MKADGGMQNPSLVRFAGLGQGMRFSGLGMGLGFLAGFQF